MAGEVTVRTDMDALFAGIGDRVVDTIHKEIDLEVRSAFAAAQTQWPVRTGASKASMRLDATGEGDARRWVIRVDAFYAGMIKRAGRPEITVRAELLGAPLRAAVDRALVRAAARVGG